MTGKNRIACAILGLGLAISVGGCGRASVSGTESMPTKTVTLSASDPVELPSPTASPVPELSVIPTVTTIHSPLIREGSFQDGRLVRWSPSGDLLVIGGNSRIQLVDPDSLATLGTASTESEVVGLSFSPGGDHLVSIMGSSPQVILWTLPDLEPDELLESFPSAILEASFHPEGDLFLVAHTGPGETVILLSYDLKTGETETSSIHPELPIASVLEVSPASDHVLIGRDGGLEVWASGELEPKTRLESAGVIDVSFAPSGRLIGSTHAECRGQVWGGTPLSSQLEFKYCTSPPPASYNAEPTFSRNDELIAVANHQGDVHVWRIEIGELISSFTIPERPQTSVSFSPDGSMLATIGGDGLLQIWAIDG